MALGDLAAFWKGEVEHRLEGTPQAVNRAIEGIAQALTAELEFLGDYFEQITKDIQGMFKSNSFFLKDVTSVLKYFGSHLTRVL